MVRESDIAYIAGLFDGEGSVTYKNYMRRRTKKEKAYPTWNIQLEVSMTEESIIRWLHEVLNVGSVSKRPPHKNSMGRKMQWRWRCSHREAYHVCCLIWPYSHIKLDKIQKIIDHYGSKDNVVNLEEYRISGRKLPGGMD
tara:strand:- start:626 stop:1045 length:420 start_codon:yes stop_codon:yes gene_type:complete